ncbi:MAG: hypothetical protein Q8N88_00760 [Nanoarchaeota archaeon]|nr:hypothetical protein [Nanoarchaeota archaeon]
MSKNQFNDENVNDYMKSITVDELKKLVDELKSDFDSAISSRFEVSSSESVTLKDTPSFFKTVFTSAFQNLLTIRESKATANFEISGLIYEGSGEGLTKRSIQIEIGHKPDCTWYIKVTISKD